MDTAATDYRAGSVSSVDTLDKGKSWLQQGERKVWGFHPNISSRDLIARFHHATHKDAQFKAYELLISVVST